MNLQLSLISNWFHLTKLKIKSEDYREITPYFCNKFLLFNGKSMSKKWWFLNFFENRSIKKTIVSLIGNTTFKNFNSNIMTLGYPKSTYLDRILKLEHKGIEIREGNPDWGAEAGKLYFVIKHGEIL